MRNQQFKILIRAVFDLINMINGSDYYYGTHKVGYKSKNQSNSCAVHYSSVTLYYFHLGWSTVIRFSSIFSRSMMNQISKFDHMDILGLLKSLNGSDFSKGAHRNSEMLIQHMDFFANILKYMRNQRLKIHLIAILDLINKIKGSDCDCGTQTLGFQSKKP